MRNFSIAHEFVEEIPEKLKAKVLYISIQYTTASHKCFCGCGKEVVTPISPADWRLVFDGKTVSLKPSIGNWSYKCRSHYWIKHSQVVWCDDNFISDHNHSIFDRMKKWVFGSGFSFTKYLRFLFSWY